MPPKIYKSKSLTSKGFEQNLIKNKAILTLVTLMAYFIIVDKSQEEEILLRDSWLNGKINDKVYASLKTTVLIRC